MPITETNQIQSVTMDNVKLEASINESQEIVDDALRTQRGSFCCIPGCPLSLLCIPCYCIPCCVSLTLN